MPNINDLMKQFQEAMDSGNTGMTDIPVDECECAAHWKKEGVCFCHMTYDDPKEGAKAEKEHRKQRSIKNCGRVAKVVNPETVDGFKYVKFECHYYNECENCRMIKGTTQIYARLQAATDSGVRIVEVQVDSEKDGNKLVRDVGSDNIMRLKREDGTEVNFVVVNNDTELDEKWNGKEVSKDTLKDDYNWYDLAGIPKGKNISGGLGKKELEERKDKVKTEQENKRAVAFQKSSKDQTEPDIQKVRIMQLITDECSKELDKKVLQEALVLNKNLDPYQSVDKLQKFHKKLMISVMNIYSKYGVDSHAEWLNTYVDVNKIDWRPAIKNALRSKMVEEFGTQVENGNIEPFIPTDDPNDPDYCPFYTREDYLKEIARKERQVATVE